ncbi:MAG: methyltransferase domain-containing protein [Deltaproteobacteria bacterium]|nr:methyltransferase domain-containing protein [Deltaproteobacteria bacterium]
MSIKQTIKKALPPVVLEAMTIHGIARLEKLVCQKNEAVIKGLLNGARPIKIEIGAGKDRGMEGWTSVDMNDDCALNLDLLKPIPFPDDSVSMIYSSHVLEHFKISEIFSLLSECKRILKPNGIFSAAVPNARIYIEAYQNPGAFDPEKFCGHKPAFNYNSKIDYLNYMAYMDGHHRYMFDEENILAILKKAGFKNPRLREFDPELDLKVRDSQSIYVIAEK